MAGNGPPSSRLFFLLLRPRPRQLSPTTSPYLIIHPGALPRACQRCQKVIFLAPPIVSLHPSIPASPGVPGSRLSSGGQGWTSSSGHLSGLQVEAAHRYISLAPMDASPDWARWAEELIARCRYGVPLAKKKMTGVDWSVGRSVPVAALQKGEMSRRTPCYSREIYTASFSSRA